MWPTCVLLNEVDERLDPCVVTDKVAHCLYQLVVHFLLKHRAQISAATNHASICGGEMEEWGVVIGRPTNILMCVLEQQNKKHKPRMDTVMYIVMR